MEGKVVRVKTGCLPMNRYLSSIPAGSDQTCPQRENWEKLEGEEELKPGKDVRKAERD